MSLKNYLFALLQYSHKVRSSTMCVSCVVKC